jgi:hypothetical protein
MFVKKIITQSFIWVLIITLCLLLSHCESTNRYYRPDTPEKISVVGIIDADDTIRYISFEKSYQKEYPDEINDSIRDLSFKIRSPEQDLFNYSSDVPIKNLQNLKIPREIQFNSGEKYFLEADEKSFHGIFSEVIVPSPPEGLTLLSINKETIPLPQIQECPPRSQKYRSTKYAVISLLFDVDKYRESYYSLFVEANGGKNPSSTMHYFLPIEFSLRESNAPGFLATMEGLYGHRWDCNNNVYQLQYVPINAYFIDANKIQDDKCTIKVAVKFGDLTSAVDFIMALRIKLLAIPKELFLFEKSVYSYSNSTKDPFAEPVYLEGNIKGGNGVFAICRSADLTFQWLGN